MKSHVRSWAAWAAWIVVGVAWELWCVFAEKRTGDEPLTRVVRDRLMKNARPWVAWPAHIAVLTFLGYLVFHWLAAVPW